jgi:tetratricopeptide (TPR) repeat protein
MKRCPECRRNYYDDSLAYCLDDGTALLEGPASSNEMPTAILPGLEKKNVVTRTLADESRSFRTGEMAKESRRLHLVVGLSVVAAAVMALSFAVYFRNETASSIESPEKNRSKAYDYYLRGKIKVGSENPEDNEASIKLFEEAVATDPNYAEAYAALAQAYNVKAFRRASEEERNRLNDDAEVAMERSLALNPNLAEGHFARGLILWTPEKRFPHEQAIQSYKRAIALDPNLDDAHHRLAVVYFHIGLFDKAHEELEKTLAINPNNTLGRFRLGIVYAYRGRYEEALATFKTVPLDASPASVDRNIADVLFRLGRIEESAAVVNDFLKKYPTDEGGNVTSINAMLLAKAGRASEAEEAIQRAIEIGRGFGHFHHTAYNIAAAYSLLNRPDEAVRWLTVAADDGFPCYPYFQNDRVLDNIRNNPAFTGFMVKLEEQWKKYNAAL